MEILYYITVGIALFALTLIINLFFSLKKSDELIEGSKIKEEETKPVHVPKKPAEKRGKSLKTLKHDLKKQELKDYKHGLLVTNLKGHINSAKSGSYAQNGKIFVSCDGEQSILIWNVKDFGKGNTVFRVNTDYEKVKTVHFSNDSKAIIASLEASNKTRVFKVVKRDGGYSAESIGGDNPDYHSKAEIHSAEIGVQFQSGIQSGAFLFHVYRDHAVVLTDLRGTILGRVNCGPASKGQVHLSKCSRYIGFCGDSPELRIWTIIFKSGVFVEIKRLPSLCGHKSNITSFCFSPDSTKILTLSGLDNVFKLWNMDVDWVHGNPPQELMSFSNTFGAIDSLVISPDNLVVAAPCMNNVTFFGLSSHSHTLVLEKMFNAKIQHVEFDPSSNFVAITGDKFVRVFENYVGWLARISEYNKTMQLASNATHLTRLSAQLAEANQVILRMDKALKA